MTLLTRAVCSMFIKYLSNMSNTDGFNFQDIKEVFTVPVELEEHPFSPFHEFDENDVQDNKPMKFSSYYATFL